MRLYEITTDNGFQIFLKELRVDHTREYDDVVSLLNQLKLIKFAPTAIYISVQQTISPIMDKFEYALEHFINSATDGSFDLDNDSDLVNHINTARDQLAKVKELRVIASI